MSKGCYSKFTFFTIIISNCITLSTRCPRVQPASVVRQLSDKTDYPEHASWPVQSITSPYSVPLTPTPNTVYHRPGYSISLPIYPTNEQKIIIILTIFIFDLLPFPIFPSFAKPLSSSKHPKTHLPLYKSFPCIKSQYNNHILTDDCNRIRFLVQCEARLNAKEMLQ